jgi:hypothetical protein
MVVQVAEVDKLAFDVDDQRLSLEDRRGRVTDRNRILRRNIRQGERRRIRGEAVETA